MRAYLAPGDEFAIDLSHLVEPIERELLFAAYDSDLAKLSYRPSKSPFALELPTPSRKYSVLFGCLEDGENHAILTWVVVRYNVDLVETTLAFFGGHVLSTALDPESGQQIRAGGVQDFLMQLPRAFVARADETTETSAPLYTSLNIDLPKTMAGTLLTPHAPPDGTDLIPASWFLDEVGMTFGSRPKASK